MCRTSGLARRSSALFVSPSHLSILLGRFRGTLSSFFLVMFIMVLVVSGMAVLLSAPIVEVLLPRCPFCDTGQFPRCWWQQLGDPNQFLP